jgi:hypothetical protein
MVVLDRVLLGAASYSCVQRILKEAAPACMQQFSELGIELVVVRADMERGGYRWNFHTSDKCHGWRKKCRRKKCRPPN